MEENFQKNKPRVATSAASLRPPALDDLCDKHAKSQQITL
jgi:hypothetical protein